MLSHLPAVSHLAGNLYLASDGLVGRTCIETDQDNVSQSTLPARVSGDRPVTHSLAFFPPNSVVGRRAFVFLPFVFDPVHPRVRLSRHPNVLFGNMSPERTADRPQSVAFSNVRVPRPSVPLLQC